MRELSPGPSERQQRLQLDCAARHLGYIWHMQINAADPVLAVHELQGSAQWFAAVLDARIDEVDPGNWTFCRCGGVTFMLGRCPDALPAAEIGDHSYVAYLRVDDVDAFHARAIEAGAEVLTPPVDRPWGQREMALRSPEGHRFMLGQPIRA